MRRSISKLGYALALCAGCGAGESAGGGPSSTDAGGAAYSARGPLDTSTCLVFEGSSSCVASSDVDAASARYEVFYPSSIASSPQRAPLLTWGSGTGATPDQYSVLLSHLASWGFVVVASTSPNTGTGAEMLAGEDFLVAADADLSSLFHGKLDIAHIGALGHSQGCDGAEHALLAADTPATPASSHAFIQTIVVIEPPGQQWTCFGSTDPSCPAAESFDSSSLRYGSVFFVDGSKDLLISPPTQAADTAGEQSVAAYYAATPASTPRAKATLIGADHNDIQDDCAAGFGCAGVGPSGYLGVITAWLRYELASDDAAGLTFRGPSPSIDHDPTWEDTAQSALP